MASPDDEERWVRLSRDGDPEAFGALVEQYQQMVHALTYRMTGSKDDAEDLAQETFLRAYHRLGQFRGEARFASWLGQIAVNTSLNWLRRRRRLEALHQAWAAQERILGEAPHGIDPGPETERDQRVARALTRLPPKQRAAIVLTVYEERTHAEAARELGCSEATVSWRCFVARTKLKQWLKPLGASASKPG